MPEVNSGKGSGPRGKRGALAGGAPAFEHRRGLSLPGRRGAAPAGGAGMNRFRMRYARGLSVGAFSFSFAYLLSFLFEGPLLYRLLALRELEPGGYILAAMAAHCAGLFTCGLFVRSQAAARRMMLAGMGLCFAAALPFFFGASFLWLGGLLLAG